MCASGTTSDVDVGGADALLPHWTMASSVVQVLYALQDSRDPWSGLNGLQS
jgi:hypothetical protein